MAGRSEKPLLKIGNTEVLGPSFRVFASRRGSIELNSFLPIIPFLLIPAILSAIIRGVISSQSNRAIDKNIHNMPNIVFPVPGSKLDNTEQTQNPTE